METSCSVCVWNRRNSLKKVIRISQCCGALGGFDLQVPSALWFLSTWNCGFGWLAGWYMNDLSILFFFPGGPSVYRFNVRNLVLNRFCPLEQTCLHPRKSMFGRWIKLPFGTFLFRPHFQGSANVCFAGFRVECTVHVKVAVQPTPLVVIATGTRRGQCCCGGCHPNLRDAECCRDGARQGVGWLGGDVGSSAVGFLGPICSPFWFTEFHAKYNSCWMIFNES